MYWKLFTTFAKIGAFTIGGGYAMIPLIEDEVVRKKKWMDEDEFTEALTIAQTAPGLLAVNISIFVGHKVHGTAGSVVATIGSILPSFLMILLIAMVFTNFRENPTVNAIFKGMRPAVVALIAVPMINMLRRGKIEWTGWVLAAVTLALIAFLHVSPIYILLTVAVGALIAALVQTKGRRSGK